MIGILLFGVRFVWALVFETLMWLLFHDLPIQRLRLATAGQGKRRGLAKRRTWFDVSTVGSMNSLFNKIFEDAIFVARDSNLMANLVTPYSATGFMNRVLPVYPSLTASEVAEGVDFSNAVDWTKQSQMELTPKRVMAQSLLTDQRIATDPDNAQRDCVMELGGAIGTKIDTDLVGLFGSFSSDKGAAGSALTLSKCAAGLSVLRNRKVRAPYTFVLHPYGWHDLWIELGQPATNQALLGDAANQALRDYFVQRMINADWFTSANISVDGSDDAISGVFNREALALDTRKAPTLEPQRDASQEAWELNMSAWYASGVRRSTYGVKLTHDASEPS